MTKRPLLFPGHFNTAADNRRYEFDAKNCTIYHNNIPVDIDFFGDSVINRCELNLYFHRYGMVINRGISGDVTEFALRRFDPDVLALYPRVCVMLIGGDSLKKIDREPDCTDDEMVAAFEDYYRPMMEMAKETGQKMILGSILPLRGTSDPLDRRNRCIIRMNDRIRTMAEEYGFPYVDFHRAFVCADGLTMREGLSADDCHPDSAGYTVMAELLYPVLDSILK